MELNLKILKYLIKNNNDNLEKIHVNIKNIINFLTKNKILDFLKKNFEIKIFFDFLKIEKNYLKILKNSKIDFLIKNFEEKKKIILFFDFLKEIFLEKFKIEIFQNFEKNKKILKILNFFFRNKKNYILLQNNNWLVQKSLNLIFLNFEKKKENFFLEKKIIKKILNFSSKIQNEIFSNLKNFSKKKKILILSENNFCLEKKKILDKLISEINFLDFENKDYFILILKNKKYLKKISQNFFEDFLKIILKFFKNFLFQKNSEKKIFNEISIFLNFLILDENFKNKIFNSLKTFLEFFDFCFFENENFFKFLKNFIKNYFSHISKFSEYIINKLITIFKNLENSKKNFFLKIEILKLIKKIIKKLEIENINFLINLLIFFYDYSKKFFEEEIIYIIIKINSKILEKNNLNNFLIFFLENYFDFFKIFFLKNQKFQILILKNIHFFFQNEKNFFLIKKTEIIFGNLIFYYNLDFENNFLEKKFSENEFFNLLEIFQNSLSLNLSENFIKNIFLNFLKILNFSNQKKNFFYYQINILFFLIIHFFIDYLIFFKIDLNFIFELFLNFDQNFLKTDFEKKIFLISKITFLEFFSNLDFFENDKKKFFILINSIFENFFNFEKNQNYFQNRNILQKINNIERYFPLSQINEISYFKSFLEKIQKKNFLDQNLKKKKNLLKKYKFVEIENNVYVLRKIFMISSNIKKFVN